MLVRAEEFRHTPMIGRTHGVHAEPTTFGLKLLGFGHASCGASASGWPRRSRASRVGKLSGAVGTYANSDPRVEDVRAGRARSWRPRRSPRR